MKTKLHFGILVILLAFLGTYLEQTTIPNQQIVIQFSNENISSEDTENAIEEIENKLQSIGITHIQIGQHEDGKLKIKYYSDADVGRIQNILSSEDHFKFAYNSTDDNSNDFPENRTTKDYELNISEIQNSNHINWNFERTEVVELNQKSDTSYNPRVNSSGEQINIKLSNSDIRIAIKVSNSIAIAIDHLSCKIPEVRAGPTS